MESDEEVEHDEVSAPVSAIPLPKVSTSVLYFYVVGGILDTCPLK